MYDFLFFVNCCTTLICSFKKVTRSRYSWLIVDNTGRKNIHIIWCATAGCCTSSRTNRWMRSRRTYARCSWIKVTRLRGRTSAACTKVARWPATLSLATTTAARAPRKRARPYASASPSCERTSLTPPCPPSPASELLFRYWLTRYFLTDTVLPTNSLIPTDSLYSLLTDYYPNCREDFRA